MGYEEEGAGDGGGEEESGDEEEETKYYVVKWDGEPYKAGSNEVINVGMNTVVRVKEGEWLCQGKWLYPLSNAPNWYYMKRQNERAIMWMKQVVAADIQMALVSPGNRLPVACGNRSERRGIGKN